MESEPTDPEVSDPPEGDEIRPRRRWPWVLIALLVGVEALYLVAANLYLSTDLAPRTINRKPEKLLVSYDSAWSPWPGEVRVRGLRIRGQGRRLQWTATADRISGRIGLVPLLWKSFRASDVEGDRVMFRLRRREDRPLPKKEVEAAATDPGEPGDEALAVGTEGDPPIPGLENPPEPAPEGVYPPLDPDRRKWTVVLSGFDLARVSEVWIDRVRVRGSMALRDGGMTLKLKESIRVHPSRFLLDGAHVLIDERVVADRLDGQVLVSSEEFDHRTNRGLDSIPFLLAEADLSARLAGLGWLNRYLAGPDDSPAAALRFGGGAGTLDVDAKLRAARFAPGSRLTLATERFAARFLDYTARGAAEVAWSVGAEDARMAATFDRYRLARDGYTAPHVVGSGLAMTLSEMGHDLPPALGQARVEIEIPPARVPELAFYNAYLPEAAGVTVRDGSATIRARFEARPADGTGSGRIDLAGDGVRATVRGEPLSGDLSVEGRFPAVDLAARRFRLDGTRVTIRNARMRGADPADGARPWAGRVTVKEGTLSPGSSPLLRARAAGAITDVRPVLHLFSAGDRLPGWVLDALGIDDVQARTDVEVGGDRVTLRGLAARADDLTVDGELVLWSGKRRDGRLLLGYKGLHLGLDLQGGETDLKLLGARRWYESGR